MLDDGLGEGRRMGGHGSHPSLSFTFKLRRASSSDDYISLSLVARMEIRAKCGGHGLVVKHTLAMGEPGVRFSLPAPNFNEGGQEHAFLHVRG